LFSEDLKVSGSPVEATVACVDQFNAVNV